jgi:predicted permease
VRQKLQATFRSFREEKSKSYTFMPQRDRERYTSSLVLLEPASAGVSGMQKNYRRSLAILGVLVVLVLLIACANVANLMTAQAAARAREMALRVSIGAGRWRLVQLVLAESALVALAASVFGGLFAWWSAPFVVSSINPPDNPARLILPADWRVMGFAGLLALGVTFLFGLVPALRASAVKPVSALKGGDDPHAKRRLMNALVAAQVAFCFLVHFVAGLFVATFDRLSNQPTGFSSDRILLLEASAKAEQPAAHWDQVIDHLRTLGGVEAASLSGWPLLSGNGWSTNILINGILREDGEPYFLGVSPGWLETMKIPLIGGRDFRPGDRQPYAAIVNEAFAKQFFDGQNPVGKTFEKVEGNGGREKRVRVEIVGYVRDARYRNMREPITPIAYLPFHGDRNTSWGAFTVRTAVADPLSLSSFLRKEVPRVRSEFRIRNIHTQAELVRSHTVRERLLAMLALFFAAVSLLLAAIGLFGVLDYSVQQRRREIGIRLALGAQPVHVARRVTLEVFAMVFLGAFAGLAAGVASERYVETLLYQVKVTDFRMLATPSLVIFAAALLAALPPVIRAVRIDPVSMLRGD